jgi:formylglycine-generating enzyme required for sulfatase activity/serine/threonine protein phosphatase PrpC
MATRFDAAGGQIDGDRDYQEDAFLITRLGQGDREGTLIVVADGMGGHAAGNVASNMAVQTFNKFITSRFPADDPAAMLRASAIQANASIAETVRETAALKGMGCTLVACLFEEERLHWVSVGDSHLYRLRDGELIKCNADHSYGAFLDRMAAEGHDIKAESGLNRNMLMSALTGDDIPEIDCPGEGLELRHGDRFIVSSDGLDSIGQARVREVARNDESARACVEALLDAVTAAAVPRQDNTTVVVIDIVDRLFQNRATFGADAASPNAAGSARPSAAAAAPVPASATGIPAGAPGSGAATRVSASSNAGAAAPLRRFEASAAARESSSSIPGMLAGLVALAVLAGGGAWWYAAQQPPELPPIDLSALPDRKPLPEALPTDAPEADADAGVDSAAVVEGAAAAGEEAPAAFPSPFRDALSGGGDAPLMVVIPGGTFTMGSSLLGEQQNESPPHERQLSAFALSAYEVRREDWNQFARARGLRTQGGAGDLPASGMNWQEAAAYAAWLAERTGQPYRLPSEAEWEYAARGGSLSLYWWGNKPGGGDAWCIGCAPGLEPIEPTRVGQFKANGYGLYDTAGNVAEWVQDCYRPGYEAASVNGAAVDEPSCSERVFRGGAWSSPSKHLRHSRRDHAPANDRRPDIGLRVARDLPPEPGR